ncbi:MAG: hypothetical protein KY476_16615, partial [Planctomycetes bacterium]|nr:hypothetical protein [Planctomycetota bacterium]
VTSSNRSQSISVLPEMSNSSKELLAEGLLLLSGPIYTDLRGREFWLGQLDDEERAVLDQIANFAASVPDWPAYSNHWIGEVARLYEGRGLSRAEVVETPLWRICQDLGGRLMADAGLARLPDYRDELADLIHRRFKSRREFCEATGISETMLSHVLARRKHLAVDTLEAALARIGCRLHIAAVHAAAEPPPEAAGAHAKTASRG